MLLSIFRCLFVCNSSTDSFIQNAYFFIRISYIVYCTNQTPTIMKNERRKLCHRISVFCMQQYSNSNMYYVLVGDDAAPLNTLTNRMNANISWSTIKRMVLKWDRQRCPKSEQVNTQNTKDDDDDETERRDKKSKPYKYNLFEKSIWICNCRYALLLMHLELN